LRIFWFWLYIAVSHIKNRLIFVGKRTKNWVSKALKPLQSLGVRFWSYYTLWAPDNPRNFRTVLLDCPKVPGVSFALNPCEIRLWAAGGLQEPIFGKIQKS
jgi:hypothetical protein